MADLSSRSTESSSSGGSSSSSSSDGKFAGFSAPQDKQGMRELVEEIRQLQQQVEALDARLRKASGPSSLALPLAIATTGPPPIENTPQVHHIGPQSIKNTPQTPKATPLLKPRRMLLHPKSRLTFRDAGVANGVPRADKLLTITKKGRFGIHAGTGRASPLLLIGQFGARDRRWPAFTSCTSFWPLVSTGVEDMPMQVTVPDHRGTFGFWVMMPKPGGGGSGGRKKEKERVHFSWRPCSREEAQVLGFIWFPTVTHWKLVCEPSESPMRVGRLENVVAWGFEKGGLLPVLAVASAMGLLAWEREVRGWMRYRPKKEYVSDRQYIYPRADGMHETLGERIVDHRVGYTARRDPIRRIGEVLF
ncbi:hypothetical protein B0T16DRAFT_459322 [Cercophora newfieldiana]|uniref:Uncharacterized protein n=1 Tax=Cercophora newfieldiana TaxID=92897 RepID=A0AA39Y0I4_9PEZI|nr:hypothetical protein B0T16DRAFT_459322 [Cercophora newfieldiana]